MRDTTHLRSTSKTRLFVLFALLCATSGCAQDASSVSQSAVEPSGLSQPALGQAAIRLALSPPTGEREKTGQDGQLLSAIRDAKAPGATAETWVVLGRRWANRARRTQNESLYNRVEAAANEALRLDPSSRKAKHLSAVVLRTRHAFIKLMALATQMTQAAPDDVTAWGALADAAFARGELRQAETAVERMLDLQPGLPALSRAAWLRWLHGDVEGALALWNEAVQLAGAGEPRAWCLNQIGELEWHRGAYARAEARYTAALRQMPDNADALLGRGRARLALGHTGDAIEDLRASIAARPHELSYDWLAVALAGDPEAVEIEGRLAAAGAFDDPRSIARFLVIRGLRPAEALRLARKDSAQRLDVQGQGILGLALVRTGHPSQGIEVLSGALRHGTPDPFLHAALGLAHVAAGQPSAARPHLEMALALNPQFHPVLATQTRSALDTLELR